MSVKSSSSIKIKVGLGENAVPEQITWAGSNFENGKENEAKAMLVSFFDKENRETLKIDLWTQDMQVMEMDRFFYQTLRGLADTYFKATKNQQLATDMQKFVQYFGEQTEIISK